MAPYAFTHGQEMWLTIGIGFLFGFVLERAGFGDARNLAAQFYLHNMRVLKVMFTAIVTAMLLVFLTSACGLLDLGLVGVPDTYLWPGLVGGLLLGVGFIIGGYCPGTSLVSVSTWKVDGFFYVAGVLFGLFVFGQTVPAFWTFFHHAGAWGRMTIPDLVGVDAGWMVLGVAVMAVGAFAFAELMERRFAVAAVPVPAVPVTPSRRLRLFRRAAVTLAVALGVVILIVGQPSVPRKMAWARTAHDAVLQERKVHIDPAEVLGMMRNNQIQLALVDVRNEQDFNVFHLLDAQRASLEQLEQGWAARLPRAAVVVVMSNDEQQAEEAWKRLAVQLNPHPYTAGAEGNRVYILAGGINRWLDIYREQQAEAPGPEVPATGDDRCRHRFAEVWGSRESLARPEVRTVQREFPSKVKAVTAKRVAGGGCG
jgi:rhodanese-related sulfurtransferase